VLGQLQHVGLSLHDVGQASGGAAVHDAGHIEAHDDVHAADDGAFHLGAGAHVGDEHSRPATEHLLEVAQEPPAEEAVAYQEL
jgi:hypothetical protein